MDRIPPVDALIGVLCSMYGGRDTKEFEAGHEYDSKTLSDVKHRLKNLKLEKEGTIKWLSVGVGEGRDLEVLHTDGLLPMDIDFYGIDTSDKRFKKVREGASRLGIPKERVHLKLVSAEKMTYVSEFDLISVVLVLHEVDPVKLPHILRKILRALKEDGTLVITDFQRPYELETEVVVWDLSDIVYLLEHISPKIRVSPELISAAEFPEEFGFYSCIVKMRGGISSDFFEKLKFEKNIVRFIISKINKTRTEKEELWNEVKSRVAEIMGEEDPTINEILQSVDKITRELEKRCVMKLYKVMLLRNQLEYLNEKFQELLGYEGPTQLPDNDPIQVYVESIRSSEFFRYITNPMVSRSIPLESSYVKLAISSVVHDPEHRFAMPDWAAGQEYQLFTERRYLEKIKEEIDPEKAVENWQRIVILGDPGSGKTMLLKYLTLEAAYGRLKGELVPFFITLGEYADPRNKATSLIEFACEQYRKRSPLDDGEFEEFVLRIRDMNERRRALFLLDGFDEIPHGRKLGVSGDIERELNRYVLSSRQVGYTGGVLNDKTLEIVELSDPAIQEFLQNWTCSQDVPDHEQSAERLIDHIQRIPRLKMLARNPLLLSIQCFVHQDLVESGRWMATRRVDLYREAINGILKTLEPRGITRDDINRLNRRINVDSVFADIAFHYFEEVENAPRHIFSREELNECLRRISGKLDDKYADILSDVVFLSGILHPLTMHEYHFLHLTFQEYYTAYHLANQEDGIKTIVERKRCRHWQEVIPLYAGMKSERFQELMDRIWDKGRGEDLFYNDLFLIGRCLAEVDLKRANIKSRDVEEIKNQLLELSLHGKFDMWRDGANEVLSHISYQSGAIEDKLIESLKDDDSDVRRAATYALGEIRAERAVEHLIPLLKDDKSYVSWEAARVLGRIGAESAIGHLIPLLNEDDSDVKQRAARALGEIGDERAIEHLIPLLKDDNSHVRWVVARALGEIGAEGAIEHLIPLLNGDQCYVSLEAARALREIGDESAIEHLIPRLKEEDEENRWAATYAQESMAESAIEHLIPLLQEDDSDVKQEAARALSGIGAESAIEHLIPLLKDDNSDVREMAARALGEIGAKSDIEHLVPLLKDDGSHVKVAAARALEEIGAESAIEYLIPLLKGNGIYVSGTAAEALKRISEKNDLYIPMSKYTDL